MIFDEISEADEFELRDQSFQNRLPVHGQRVAYVFHTFT